MARLRHLATLCLCAAAACAHADPGYYVVTAYDNAGQRSIDFRYWSVALPGRAHANWPEVGLGYGVNSRWYTEVYASYITSSEPTHLDTLNWQNDVLLTQGQWPFDLALHLNLSRYRGSESGTVVEAGPVFQTDAWRTQFNFNLFFQREFGSEDASGHTDLNYQWQVRHRWSRPLQFGAQGFGEIGRWDRWPAADRQSHRAGPALFGSVDTGAGQVLQYQVAYLWGRIYGRSGNMLTLRTQLVF